MVSSTLCCQQRSAQANNLHSERWTADLACPKLFQRKQNFQRGSRDSIACCTPGCWARASCGVTWVRPESGPVFEALSDSEFGFLAHSIAAIAFIWKFLGPPGKGPPTG